MKVILITGAPGTGKSATAEALSRRFEKSAHIQVDFFRKMVKAGYASPHNWNEEVEKQYFLARKNAALTAFNLANSGFTVIVDDIVRQHWVEEWKQNLGSLEINLVLLNPQLETAKERNIEREIWTVDENVVMDLHKLLEEENTAEKGWIVIDNTNKTIDETVAEVVEKIN